MATRNRTSYFKQCRSSSKVSPFKGYEGGGEIEMGGSEAPPFWVVYCSEAEKDLATIRDLVPELEKLHKSALVDFNDDMETEHEIELQTGQISDVFQHCQSLIRLIGKPPKGTKETPDQTKSRHNAQIALATSLQNLSQDFRRSQSNYLKKLQGTEERTKEVLSGNSILADDDDYDVDPGFTDQQMLIVQDAENLAEEREREINNIAKSINELAQIFKEMHVLVIDQGTILDRIDYNIEKVVTFTEEAHVDLKESEKSQKSYRKKLCILLLIVVVVALVLFLVATNTKLGSKPTDAPTDAPTTAPNSTRAGLEAFGFVGW